MNAFHLQKPSHPDDKVGPPRDGQLELEVKSLVGLDIASAESILQRVHVRPDAVNEYVDSLSCDGRAIFGEFLGACVETGRYPEAFHRCFRELSEEAQERFCKKFQRPEVAALRMIAPFASITGVATNNSDPARLHCQQTMLGAAKPDFYQLCEITDSILKFGTQQRKMQFVNFLTACVNFKVPHEARSPYLEYPREFSFVLLTRLPALVDSKILGLSVAEAIFSQFCQSPDGNRGGAYLSYSLFSQPYVAIEDLFIKKGRRALELQGKKYEHHYSLPESVRERVDVFERRARADCMQVLAGVIPQFEALFGAQLVDRFIISLLNFSHPILSYLRLDGFDFNRLQRINAELRDSGESIFCAHDGSDVVNLYRSGFSSLAVREAVSAIALNGSDSALARQLVKNFSSTLGHMSGVDRSTLCKTITVHCPLAWAESFNAFQAAGLGDEVVFENFLRRAMKSPRDYLVVAGELKRQGSVSPVLLGFAKRLIGEVREVLKNRPSELAEGSYAYRALVSPAERTKIFRDALVRDPEERLLGSLLSDIDEPYMAPLLPLIRTLLSDNPELQRYILVHSDPSYGWEKLRKLFPANELFGALRNAQGRLDLSIPVCGTYRSETLPLFVDLLSDPVQRADLFAELRSPENRGFLPIYLEVFGEIFELDEKSRADQQPGAIPDELRRGGVLAKVRHELHQILEVLTKDERLSLALSPQVLSEPILLGLIGDPDWIRAIDYFKRNSHQLMHRSVIGLIPKAALRESIVGSIGTVAFYRERRGEFWISSYLGELDETTRDALLAINPLLSFRYATRLERDLYDEVLAAISGMSAFRVFERDLQRMAAQERESGYVRLRGDLSALTPQFTERAVDVVALNFVFGDSQNLKCIASADADQRKVFVELLHAAIDRNVQLHELRSLPALSMQELLDRLIQLLRPSLAEELQLSLAILPTDGSDLCGLVALADYRRCCVSRHPELHGPLTDLLSSLGTLGFEAYRFGDRPGLTSLQTLAVQKTERLLPEKLSLQQFDRWRSTQYSSVQESLEVTADTVRFAIREVLDNAEADGHFDGALLSLSVDDLERELDKIEAPIRSYAQEIEAIELGGSGRESGGRRQELKMRLARYRQDHENELQRFEAFLILKLLPAISDDALRRGEMAVRGRRFSLSKLSRVLERGLGEEYGRCAGDIERITDLIRAYAHPGSQRLSRQELVMSDSVHLSTYARIGAVPVPSCQHFRAESDLNRGLLGLLVDPNVKVIQVATEDGTLIARALLRLLSDGEGQPQLFLERVYSSNPHPKISEAIVNFGRRKAREMGVQLFAKAAVFCLDGTPLGSGTSLYSKGSRSAWVYSDAASGNEAQGSYSIEGLHSI